MSTRPGPATTPRPGPPTFGLAPDKEQAALLKRYFGVSRYAYNWVLYANRDERLAGEDLRGRFEEAVAKDAPWVREVPVAIVDAAIRQAERDLSFLRGKGRRPRYRRKEDDASVRIDADAEGFRIGQGGVQLPEVGKLSLIGGNSRIGGAVEAVVILLAGEDWKVQFLLARGDRRDRTDNRQQRDRDLPAWQRRGEGERIDALPESVQLVREADDGTTVVVVGSGSPPPPEPAPAAEPVAEAGTVADAAVAAAGVESDSPAAGAEDATTQTVAHAPPAESVPAPAESETEAGVAPAADHAAESDPAPAEVEAAGEGEQDAADPPVAEHAIAADAEIPPIAERAEVSEPVPADSEVVAVVDEPVAADPVLAEVEVEGEADAAPADAAVAPEASSSVDDRIPGPEAPLAEESHADEPIAVSAEPASGPRTGWEALERWVAK